MPSKPTPDPHGRGTMQLDIPVLLPGVEDHRDECVTRLITLLEARDGVDHVHVVSPEASNGQATKGLLCLHYDPELLTLGQIYELAEQSGAEVSERFAHEVFTIRAIGPEDDGRRIEQSLRGIRGVTAAVVSVAAQTARVEYDRTVVTREAILEQIAKLGIAPDVARADKPTRKSWYQRNHELAWSLLAGAGTGAGWLFSHGSDPAPRAAIAAFVFAYFWGARDNVAHLLKDLRRGHFHFNIDFLMVVAAIGAAVLGDWFEGGLLLFLFSFGHALEHYAMGRARNAIKALGELTPDVATIRRGGRDEATPIANVKLGDTAVIKPGERLPVDGKVREGRSAVNQAPITGESVPVDKAPGDDVFAGSVNGEGVLLVEVTVATGDRTLDRVIKLVSEASTQKAKTQQFTDRFQRWFVPTVLVADLLLIVVPPLLGLMTWSDSFYRAMALLVAASPCALALGTPAAVLSGIAQAARHGVLIKGGAHLEALGGVQAVALDKTGTITRGEPAVTDLISSAGVAEDELLRTAAAVEGSSQHPLARAIVKRAGEKSLTYGLAADATSVTGKGIRATVDGRTIEVGRLTMFENAPPDVVATVQRLESAGRSTMIVRDVGRSPEWLGVIGVADEPRHDVKETLDALRRAGVSKIVMLTGDNAGAANAVGKSVGVDEVRAGLMPEDKVTAIKELVANGPAAMVGDGVNDAPALAHATVGIAMGGAGTAAALETADVALMSDDLSRLPFAIGLSRQARSVIRQNLYVSLGVIVALILTTTLGLAGIGPTVIVHEGSTLVVIVNALRLLTYRGGLNAQA